MRIAMNLRVPLFKPAAGLGPVARFGRNEGGSVTVEFLMSLPLLIWAFVALFSFWDVYSSRNVVQKAAFVVADTLARTPGSVTTAYIDGLLKYQNYLIGQTANSKLRISSIRWNLTNQAYEVSWSYSPKNALALRNNASLIGVQSSLPILSQFEDVLLVESWIGYDPPIAAGLIGSLPTGIVPSGFNEFNVMRPRFIPKVCITTLPCN